MTVREVAPDHAAMTQALLTWYAAHRRDLPWRATTDPYHVWVAEIMLQQTRVSTVVPYYHRFLKEFSTVESLARAELDRVLAVWEGLGYYARARSLHAAAKIVHERHAGRIPASLPELMALPGIGRYTAGAILSIAFGQDVPAMDANAIRVLCRLFDYDGDPTSARGKMALRRHAEALLPPGRAGEYNQALMDLGATVCLPRSPRCPDCPLVAPCRARALGHQEMRPVPRGRRSVPHRESVALLAERAGKVLVVRRIPQGLLGGLWELPGGDVRPGEEHGHALARHLHSGLGVEAGAIQPAITVRHGYTHFRVTVHAYRGAIRGKPSPADGWDAFHWLSASELDDYGLTGVTSKVLARAGWLGSAVPV